MTNQETAPTAKDYYFDSYAHFGIHEEMLKDSVRTLAYKDAILGNKHLFKDKIVLDVGCGTGILSMFCAKAGAKMVIGVDMSDIIHKAREIVKENNLSEIVTLIQGKIEEVELPVPKVDIIVSEWMGYFLLYESMLNSVLVARDRFLAPGGIILPDKATLLLAGIEDAEYKDEKISYWDNVYGFKMSCLKEIALKEPLVDTVEAKAVMTTAAVLKEIDIMTVKEEELSFKTDFELKATRSDFAHGFVGYFDIEFSFCHKPVRFSTGPHAKYTHWKQTVFYTHNDLIMNPNESIKGTLSLKPNERNPRDLDILIDFKCAGKDCNVSESLKFQMS
ncbi:S-adenosyl-L-methionine-dependent methyltransferase [Rozella allomycis CSF55]|uniref:type I protein arginine methyltransferase n=1 Tax=Rozella allomycis (strain CSF55) TaxID=988480 RepID=A0A075AWJ8_ROZAC|nr:putative protein arginine N-methyltransferase [Rozella allomycis CSF55]RKP21549.1 S-adenosyl-L-methionine-dependent methyltransferase [Rozella allomycis CSF55]|eukprot:EPZ34592.1 putative protein arginine N-methyltransferase [Rozella allomycis CSF55]